MAIDLITANPDENDPATIATEIDLFVQQIKAAIPQFNTEIDNIAALAAALNFNSTNATSSTSVAIGTGNKSFTTQTGKSYVTGMTVRIANTADETKWMQGEVESYNSGTGALVVNVTHTNGTGTLAAWTISLSARIYLPYTGDQKVVVHTGNGHGSTNTKIRRFTTVLTNVGSSITYADSATLGASFTINNAGIYAVHYADASSDGQVFGVSLNSSQLTTSFTSINAANRILLAGGQSTATLSCSGVGYFNASDVLRAHTAGAASGTSNVMLSVERLF